MMAKNGRKRLYRRTGLNPKWGRDMFTSCSTCQFILIKVIHFYYRNSVH